MIKKPSHEDFVTVWSEAVFGKGLMFDFFSDPLKWLVLFQVDVNGGIRFICTHVCFIMDKTFCRVEHDDEERKDLFQFMQAFSKRY